MKISRNWLQTYFDDKIPEADKLAEIFTFHAFEVESQEKVEKNGEIVEDDVLDVKVLPDRAHYALSHNGIALEVSANSGLKLKSRYHEAINSNIDNKPNIVVSNPEFCRRYIARYIKLGNLPKESPIWLKNALHSIGQRSISTIVDITNYVMYDIGQPLHAFDADKVVGGLTIRNANAGEKIILLDGRELELTVEDSVIADDQGPLVVAGAKGGKRAEIDENTKNIIIESANFHPTKVRRTSTKYDIRSDSSKRFENEISPELAIHGMNNVCKLISEIIPNSSFGPISDFYPKPVKKTALIFDTSYICQKLGVTIDETTIKVILQKLGFDILPKNIDKTSVSSTWNVVVPFERLDITSKEDLVEEVGRVYGYDKVRGILPPQIHEKQPSLLPIFYISELIKSKLIDLGFSEVSLYSLVSTGHHETAKPLAKDKAFARAELSQGMIECVQKNTLNADLLGLDSIKIFEIGHIFTKESEKTNLVIGANQIKKIKGYKAENIVNEAIAHLQNALNIPFEAKISKDKTGNIAVAEINLDHLVDSYTGNFEINKLNLTKSKENRFKKFSIYPFIVRDIAILVPNNVENEQVWSKIIDTISNNNSKDLLVRHSLFDTYKKDDSTSYAWRMVFQANDRTLTDEEINTLMEKIYITIKDNNWAVR